MRTLLRITRITMISLGGLFLLGVVLAFTSAPFWIWYGMGTARAKITDPPDYIVVLGGSGIPSESGLMRTYYATRAADHFPHAMLIVALPGDTADSLSSVFKMKEELILRGIAPERILLEDSGTNTRAQALMVKELILDARCSVLDARYSMLDARYSALDTGSSSHVPRPTSHVLLITSPEHLYRAVLTFEKAGFEHVDGLPAFASAVESDISFSARRLGGRKWVPDIGDSITLRYQFWTQLHYELLILREWMAIAYYWINGWI